MISALRAEMNPRAIFCHTLAELLPVFSALCVLICEGIVGTVHFGKH